ncbi:hypothetical protein BDA99DRAFT_571863 [Phascolomyces articulosus]|uniref:Uncharacterized protein n=1 Tax=Phascolomyces articulosus TaxID=60185 RepID=A0AAD5K062_9FUNG|nr:hypothetical protein BDA99DRAFT_571863 [Phascolomyces articulosus]
MSEEDRKKRRLCNNGPDRWRMNNNQLFSHLKLSTVSTELLMKCGLYSDDANIIVSLKCLTSLLDLFLLKIGFEVIDCPRILAYTYNQPVVLYSINGIEVGGTTFLPFKKPKCGSDGYMIDVSPIILVLQGAHIKLIVLKDNAVDRVTFPKLFPGYANLISNNQLPSSWLNLYQSRCQTD